MYRLTLHWLLLVAAGTLLNAGQCAASWRVGSARVDITPQQKLWLAGYASRTRPADGMLHPLWAKALAIEDTDAHRVVIVTLDLIGDNFGRALADRVRMRISAGTSLVGSEIVFNFSHTHSGPVTRLNDGATVTYRMNSEQQAAVAEYTRELEGRLVGLVLRAWEVMQPGHVEFGTGIATFAANRRLKLNPDGPVDHSVPVLRVTDLHQNVVAVLFGYACHTAALTGESYDYSGDYAGFAQAALEREYPAATAMFMMGCGGDANPQPRGTPALAERHGEALATAVRRVLAAEMKPLSAPLRVQLRRVNLDFVDPPTRAELASRPETGDVYEQRLTKVLLSRLDRGEELVSSYPFPIHSIRFGHDLTLVALAGETVVDYAIRLRQELPNEPLWIAGYCNEVFAYIPSERVLLEGGYEGGGAMRYFGIHGPFKPGLEQRIVDLAKQLVIEGKPTNSK